jgi:hypothetical protein
VATDVEEGEGRSDSQVHAEERQAVAGGMVWDSGCCWFILVPPWEWTTRLFLLWCEAGTSG